MMDGLTWSIGSKGAKFGLNEMGRAGRSADGLYLFRDLLRNTRLLFCREVVRNGKSGYFVISGAVRNG
ncbi:MAG: hypothetical protein RIG62_12115 [Cyclobacteriaceae bacterium]